MNKKENDPLKETKDIQKFPPTQDAFSFTADFRIFSGSVYFNDLRNENVFHWENSPVIPATRLLIGQSADGFPPDLALVMPFQQLF